MPRRALLLLPLALLSCGKKPLEGLKTYNYLGGDQRSGSLTYNENPPVGGPYNPLWQTCATYTQPIYNEYAVHSLARGAVWVTYRPGLEQAQLDSLKTLLAGRPAIISPYPNLPVALALTVWNQQITAETADDPRLKRFLDEVAAASSVPEAGASCAGGYGGTRG